VHGSFPLVNLVWSPKVYRKEAAMRSLDDWITRRTSGSKLSHEKCKDSVTLLEFAQLALIAFPVAMVDE